MTEPFSRWVAWGPDGPSGELPPAVLDELVKRQADQQERRGRLLARVDVYVYDGECLPQVTFLPDGVPIGRSSAGA